MSTRRQFLSAALVGLSAKAARPVTGSFVHDGFLVGHRLRDKTLHVTPKQTIGIPVVIVGARHIGSERSLATGEKALS